jgi:hypothetical protein
MYNILKTLFSINVIFLSFFSRQYESIKYAWIACAFVGAMVNFYWDLLVDWNLLHPNSKYKVGPHQICFNLSSCATIW